MVDGLHKRIEELGTELRGIKDALRANETKQVRVVVTAEVVRVID